MDNLPPFKFSMRNTNQGRKGNMQGGWEPDISVTVVTAVGVPAEGDLMDILMNTSISMIHL